MLVDLKKRSVIWQRRLMTATLFFGLLLGIAGNANLSIDQSGVTGQVHTSGPIEPPPTNI